MASIGEENTKEKRRKKKVTLNEGNHGLNPKLDTLPPIGLKNMSNLIYFLTGQRKFWQKVETKE